MEDSETKHDLVETAIGPLISVKLSTEPQRHVLAIRRHNAATGSGLTGKVLSYTEAESMNTVVIRRPVAPSRIREVVDSRTIP